MGGGGLSIVQKVQRGTGPPGPSHGSATVDCFVVLIDSFRVLFVCFSLFFCFSFYLSVLLFVFLSLIFCLFLFYLFL